MLLLDCGEYGYAYGGLLVVDDEGFGTEVVAVAGVVV